MAPAIPPLREILDPHVGWAIFCLLLALIAAILAFALGLVDGRHDR
jgi:hypothetical protein